MTANLFIFLLSIVIGFIITGVFALLKYSSKGAAETVDMLVGQCGTFGGLAIGALLVAAIFAFVAGKFTA